jgi:septal ring factor EnvC (AmiA/AmiB activator)
MARAPSAILSAATKKTQAKELKDEIKALKTAIKEAEHIIKVTTKELNKAEARLLMVVPAKQLPPVTHPNRPDA